MKFLRSQNEVGFLARTSELSVSPQVTEHLGITVTHRRRGGKGFLQVNTIIFNEPVFCSGMGRRAAQETCMFRPMHH